MFEKWAEKFQTRAEGNNVTFKNFDDREEIASPATVQKKAEEVPAVKNSLSSPENIELKVVRPESFDEVSSIADHLLADCTVVLNLELLDKASSLRMLDFLNGITYSKDGEIKKVAQSTYIITPNNVDVNDDK
jgi:cell division inhibitor SepF